MSNQIYSKKIFNYIENVKGVRYDKIKNHKNVKALKPMTGMVLENV